MDASRLPQNELHLAPLDKPLVETELILHFLTVWRAADPACAVAMWVPATRVESAWSQDGTGHCHHACKAARGARL